MQIFLQLRDLLWSGPLLIFLIATGIYLTWLTSGIQLRMGSLLRRKQDTNHGEGDISPMQALMTALAGAIGTGNITGIATAIFTGGYGALFWMWVVAFFGMATAYAETVLALNYREKNPNGEMIGGPMVTLKNGLQSYRLAAAFAVFGLFAALGFGMVQANSVADAIVALYDVERVFLGVAIAAIAGWVIIGGVQRIGQTAATLVPTMAVIYLGMSSVILIMHYPSILPAFKQIIVSAFTGQAAVGGFLGSTVMLAMQNGAQYGIFANEAGLGSFAIAGSSAQTDDPEQQGFLAMSGVFLATMVICTITGLVLVVTNVLGSEVNGQALNGSPLAMAAFATGHSSFPYLVIICLSLFAFTTILAWAYYGEKCLEYLLGTDFILGYRWIYIATLIIGAIISLEAVWAFSHLMNGLMVIPNLISIILLAKLKLVKTKQIK